MHEFSDSQLIAIDVHRHSQKVRSVDNWSISLNLLLELVLYYYDVYSGCTKHY